MSAGLAMVTGAASAFGAAFARTLAVEGYDVALVARRGQAMEDLAQYVEERHGVEAIVIPKDLGQPPAADEVMANLRQRHHDRVDVLVNGAGFGSAPRAGGDAPSLSVVSLTNMTRNVLPGMLERRRGIVVNPTARVPAGGSGSGGYAWHLSVALARALRGSGVTVTALCTGPIAGGSVEQASARGGVTKPPTVEEIVEWGWPKARTGRPYAVRPFTWRLGATRSASRSSVSVEQIREAGLLA